MGYPVLELNNNDNPQTMPVVLIKAFVGNCYYLIMVLFHGNQLIPPIAVAVIEFSFQLDLEVPLTRHSVKLHYI